MGDPMFSDGTVIDPTVSPEIRESGLEHVSKSRVKTYLECPRKFFLKYWCENRPPGSYHTEKGSEIHRAYEDFHLNLIEYVEEHGRPPEYYSSIMEDWRDYSQWLDPHIANFWKFEDARLDAVMDYIIDEYGEPMSHADQEQFNAMLNELWLPVGVEVEGYIEDAPGGDLPWMGYADLVAHAASIPQIEETDGVVIIDYKTGKVQDEQYREDGIYLEGEFYGWVFEEDPEFEHEIVAVAGYYPQEDEFVVSPYPDFERRNTILDAVEGMAQPPEFENYEFNEQPLCHYGHGRCEFYNVCPSTWGLAGGAGYHADAEKDNTVSKHQKKKHGV